MSVEAISWALNLAPVPLDPSGKRNSSCHFVLVGLANHAGPDGTAAFPSVGTLMRYTSLSERTVRTALDRLQELGVIHPGRTEIVAAHIRDPRYRPQPWDLDMTQIRDDLSEQDIAALERTFPGLSARLAGVQRLHPSPVRGATGADDQGPGVQLVQSRGAAAAPEPYIEPSFKNLEPKTFAQASSREPDGALFQVPEQAAPAPKGPDRAAADALFDRFWWAYPLHKGKLDARKAWDKAVRTSTPDVIIAGAEKYAADRTRSPSYTKHPGTWLRAGCWLDEEAEGRDATEAREVEPQW